MTTQRTKDRRAVCGGRQTGIQNWAVYMAFAPMDKQFTLIKIGISEIPLRRIFEVHCGSPFPIKVALWQHVGFKNRALTAEAEILRDLSAYSTRGEWLKMEMKSAEHKKLFHDVSDKAIARATAQKPKWKKTTIPAIKEILNINWDWLRNGYG